MQIAKACGATVTGVGSGKHRDFAISIGASEFINYEQQDFAELDQRWDVVFDAAGKSSYGEAKHVLKSGGSYVSTEPSLRGLFMPLATLPLERRGKVMLARPRGDDLRELMQLYAAENLHACVERVFPLEEAAEAHRWIEAQGFCGKLVLKVGS